jgi:hypothetical protein
MAINTTTRNRVAQAAAGLPTLQAWIDAVSAISPEAAQTVEGIYCGRDGRGSFEFGPKNYIVVGWHDGRVEYSYVS